MEYNNRAIEASPYLEADARFPVVNQKSRDSKRYERVAMDLNKYLGVCYPALIFNTKTQLWVANSKSSTANAISKLKVDAEAVDIISLQLSDQLPGDTLRYACLGTYMGSVFAFKVGNGTQGQKPRLPRAVEHILARSRVIGWRVKASCSLLGLRINDPNLVEMEELDELVLMHHLFPFRLPQGYHYDHYLVSQLMYGHHFGALSQSEHMIRAKTLKYNVDWNKDRQPENLYRWAEPLTQMQLTYLHSKAMNPFTTLGLYTMLAAADGRIPVDKYNGLSVLLDRGLSFCQYKLTRSSQSASPPRRTVELSRERLTKSSSSRKRRLPSFASGSNAVPVSKSRYISDHYRSRMALKDGKLPDLRTASRLPRHEQREEEEHPGNTMEFVVGCAHCGCSSVHRRTIGTQAVAAVQPGERVLRGRARGSICTLEQLSAVPNPAKKDCGNMSLADELYLREESARPRTPSTGESVLDSEGEDAVQTQVDAGRSAEGEVVEHSVEGVHPAPLRIKKIQKAEPLRLDQVDKLLLADMSLSSSTGSSSSSDSEGSSSDSSTSTPRKKVYSLKAVQPAAAARSAREGLPWADQVEEAEEEEAAAARSSAPSPAGQPSTDEADGESGAEEPFNPQRRVKPKKNLILPNGRVAKEKVYRSIKLSGKEIPYRYRPDVPWETSCFRCGSEHHLRCEARLIDQCKYQLCLNKSAHRTVSCPGLHHLCQVCGHRGHLEEQCGKYDHSYLEQAFLAVAARGRHTRKSVKGRFPVKDWGFTGPSKRLADLDNVKLYEKEVLVDWNGDQYAEYNESNGNDKYWCLEREIIK